MANNTNRLDRDATEQSPLLSRIHTDDQENGNIHEAPKQQVTLDSDDPEHPRNWTLRRKYANVAIIASMAILSPLASSMFTPGIPAIAEDLDTTEAAVVAATSGFVVALGFGPLLLAPLSETFGRRKLYLWCFSIFAVLQVPTALSPNLGLLITCRTIAGFFSSVSIANGGGTLSDMFPPSQRAGVFGWYLLGPVLGPTLGPLFGGLVVQYLGWRFVFWILTIVCSINTLFAFFFLRETYVPALLVKKKQSLEATSHNKYYIEDEDTRTLKEKTWTSVKRPLKILFTQPIVFIMAVYQAILMGCMYSIYTQLGTMFQAPPYNFSPRDVGLCYLFPGAGFLIAVIFLIPRVDTVFNALTERNGGVQKPEYRLPLANIGSVFIPFSLFYFGWTLQYGLHWAACLVSLIFFGIGVQMTFNPVQNYYIDTFERYAASAIAAGSFFRAVVGGFIPLITPQLFQALGYGWGMSVLGFCCAMLSPAPILFYVFGERLRKRFPVKLD